jgi:hypothetical protein
MGRRKIEISKITVSGRRRQRTRPDADAARPRPALARAAASRPFLDARLRCLGTAWLGTERTLAGDHAAKGERVLFPAAWLGTLGTGLGVLILRTALGCSWPTPACSSLYSTTATHGSDCRCVAVVTVAWPDPG